METNPYQAPQTVVADLAAPGTAELAGRLERLLAAIVDALIMVAIWLPIMWTTGYFTKAAAGTLSTAAVALYTIMGVVVFLLVQAWPLANTAQTWGKKVVGVRIAHLDGSQPSLGTILGKRYLPVQLVGLVPLVGPVASLVDALFIFREDRRCVHDLIAGTQVVKH